jgi:hypothetical protein
LRCAARPFASHYLAQFSVNLAGLQQPVRNGVVKVTDFNALLQHIHYSTDIKIALTYQHPELDIVRDAINSRHTLRHTGETATA